MEIGLSSLSYFQIIELHFFYHISHFFALTYSYINWLRIKNYIENWCAEQNKSFTTGILIFLEQSINMISFVPVNKTWTL